MALPTAVKRRSEKARQMVAERNGQTPKPTPQASDSEYLNVESVSSEPTQAAVIAPASAEQLASQDQNEPVRQSAPDETRIPHVLSDSYMGEAADGQNLVSRKPSQADTVNADTSSTSPQFIEENDWKARYTALRTSRDDRAAALEQENRQLKEVNQTLDKRDAPELKTASTFEVDEDTRSLLGEDQARALDDHNKTIADQNARQERERQEQLQRSTEMFESDLGSMVPRWREINVDQKFLDWLNESDEVLNVRRQSMLDGFVNSRDAASVAALFRSFVSRNEHVQQRNGQVQSPEISASRAGSGMGAEETLVETWDQSEIADFFQRKSRLYQTGKLKGEIMEQVQIEETRIRKAMQEGRVDMTR